MSQFKQRFQPHSSPPHSRESEVKLRMTPEAYAQENSDSAFARRHQETQKLKNLSFWENTDQEANDEDEWSDRQSPTPFILVMIVLVVASTLLWFLFQWASGENTNSPPIIAADTAPFKVRPENPGGMMIPHQDKLVYGRLSQDASQPIERLLPPPEQPMSAQPMIVQPMNAQPMATPPMNAQPMSAPQNQPYPEGANYSQPQHHYQPPQGVYPSNPTIPQSPQFQPQSQPGGHYQPYSAQSPHAPYQQTSPSPYAVTPQQAPNPYGSPHPSERLAPTHPIPLKAAANPIPEKQPSAVEGIKPAQEAEDENEKDSIPVKENTYVKKEDSNDLERLIAQEAQTPLMRSSKNSEGKIRKSNAKDSGKSKIKKASPTTSLKAKPKIKHLKQGRNLKTYSDS
ncbi:MAG: hypothetical protein K2Y18_07295 [Alphaproteobacteria bacterium]|jgi:hypothetical protein|nr:hypothetical protein [Alphaproteobacteria bacterium]